MSDIFREVDEDLRREQVKRLWDRYGTYVIGAAILIVVATAGYRLYGYFQDRQTAASGDRFVAAVKLADDGKHAEAIAALDAIAKDGSGGYPVLASFRSAAEKAATGDDKGAVAGFDAIAQSSSPPSLIRDMARIRAALILVETANFNDMVARIGDLAAPDNIWRHTAREILGLAAWRVNDTVNARKYFKAILDDKDAPGDIKGRASFMTALLDAREGAPKAETPKPAT
ncbi:MAG TPA: tetratricopeptide repeat protein [Bauldia sp.]|nr:tetratricopeptide repeat protein [Bauldia sp.]